MSLYVCNRCMLVRDYCADYCRGPPLSARVFLRVGDQVLKIYDTDVATLTHDEIMVRN